MLDSARALQLTCEHCLDLMPEWRDFDIEIDVLTGGITNKLFRNQNQYREPVYLIDWEYAGMNTPYYEFSDMFQEILVPRQVEDKILRAYWEDHNMDEHFFKTELFRPFPDIYWFLWSLIQRNVSHIEFDFYNYGKIKYENAQKNIQFLREHYALNI